MIQSICILGRQPALGKAELESLYGADNILEVSNNVVGLKLDAKEIDFNRLGGTIKLAKLLTILPGSNWPNIEKYLLKVAPEHAGYLPDGKLQLGLSVYDLKVSLPDVQRTGLKVKKAIKNSGRSVRIVPNNEQALNSAQVLHNKLTGPLGWELLLIKHGDQTILAQTTNEQDIEAYAARDQNRPKRDARVGMLPPKLAQIIINLANPPKDATILDPFCGTGVILQESLLMGFSVYGTDLEARMVEYTRENLKWLGATGKQEVEVADAVDFRWRSFDTVAAETYLGRPFSAEPDQQTLQKVISDVDTIHRKFLQNVVRQTKPGFRMCIAVPAWKTKSGFKHLKTLDNLAELGYNRLSFVHAKSQDLIYHREGQIVARELVVLIRK